MKKIVVGVDGSDGARRAVAWAAEEGRRRGAVVEAVHVLVPPTFVATPFGVAPVDLHPSDGGDEIEEVQAMVAAVDDAIEVTLAAGPPASALLEAATDADLLVVGSRGRGGFAGLLLGSVSQQLAHHTSVPLVIVPGS